LQYRPYRLGVPTLPLAISSAVWFSCKKLRWLLSRMPVESSLEFGLRLEYHRANLADQPQPVSPSRGLWFPTAHEGSKVHLPRARPPATVRLQGLITLLTAFALRPRAGFVSHRQRSWDSPFGAFSSRKVSGALPPGRTHLPFRQPVVPLHEASGRPGQAAVPGMSAFRESLTVWPRFSQPTAGCSLGFASAPACPERSGKRLIGICVHLAPCRTLLPTSRCSLRSHFALPQSPGSACGAEHSRFRLPVKACRPQSHLKLRGSFTTVQGHSFLSRAWVG
jgi:hypothetical protein